MKKLNISPDLSLPLDAVTQKLAFLARTGAGKTYAAQKLCEEMLAAGAQVVALDPVGVWYGLRLAADGRGTGFPIPVFGGEHGDVPLEPESGALVADLIVDRQISAVLDVSMFESKAQHKRFATDFAERLFFRKKTSRSPVHLFFEEAQEFVPQFKSRGEERMLGAFERLIKLGRNYGIGASLISQRPQAVNKDVLNQTECLFALQTTGPQERKAVAGWIHEKGLSEDIDALLPKLKIGEAHVWSPQWLGVSETVKVGRKTTFDASATPTFGSKAVKPQELSPVDVDEIRRSMAEVVRRAEENDPAKLRKRIAELEREKDKLAKELPRAVSEAATRVETKTVEVPVIADSQIARIERCVADLEELKVYSEMMRDALKEADRMREFLLEGVRRLKAAKTEAPLGQTRAPKPGQVVSTNSPQARRTATIKLDKSSVKKPATADDDFPVTNSQQRVLDAIAFYESIGNPEPSNLQVGAVALMDASGGHFSNVVGPLSSGGLIIREGGRMRLTEAGRARAHVPDRVATLGEYHDVLRARVLKARSASRRTVDILNVVISRGGEPVSNEEIGEEVGIDHMGGHFSNTIGPLSTLGLIRRSGGLVYPTEILFPEGLR
jgi:hypothetical protein